MSSPPGSVLKVDGRVQGSARDLFLRMNIIPLKSPSPGKDEAATDSFKKLGKIVAPTLVIWGDLDFPHLQERCTLLGKRIKGAKTELMPSTAHLPNLEQPKKFNALLEAFPNTHPLEMADRDDCVVSVA